jgi:lipooligosaccharide transport system ATP-binding protein
MDEAEQLCDRLVVMDQARIVAEGSPRELIDRFVQREVVELRFGAAAQNGTAGLLDGVGERVEVLADRVLIGTDDGDAVVDAVHGKGLEPESVLVRRSTLEDVFLRLTGRTLVD